MRSEVRVQRSLVWKFWCAALLAALILAGVWGGPARAQSNTPRAEAWVPNAGVFAMAKTTDTYYIAGDFNYLGPVTGHGVPLSAATARVAAVYPQVNGVVNACVPDGEGGWFIGGDFSRVGNLTRNGMAHILASGAVDAAWDANTSGTVSALAAYGSAVYAGGTFTRIGGQARNHIAALDTATGHATAWNPNANKAVNALAVSARQLVLYGGMQVMLTIYAGGDFSQIGGQPRNHLAALDTTGAATLWNPTVNDDTITVMKSGLKVETRLSSVYALAATTATVYVGGNFTHVGGVERNYLAAFDAVSGAPTAWNPNVYNGRLSLTSTSFDFPTVSALAVSGRTVYVGGLYDKIGGQVRTNLAALDAVTGAVTSWNPAINHFGASFFGLNQVCALAVSGSTVYVGGGFSDIGGLYRNNLAALDAVTGQAAAWNPAAGSTVRALAISGGWVYAGGYLNSIGGVIRNYLAAVNIATGRPTTWNPGGNWGIITMAVSGRTLYLGGHFIQVGGQTRYSLGAVDTVTGKVTGWNPDVSDGEYPVVLSLAVSGSKVYVGGHFNRIGGQSRSGLAALDAATGQATAWNPNPVTAATTQQPSTYAEVQSLAVSGSTVYVGGYFTSIGGQPRNGLAALDAATGKATAWNAYPSSAITASNPGGRTEIRGLQVAGSTVYVLGDFILIGGQSRRYLAALEGATGHATAWTSDSFGGGILIPGVGTAFSLNALQVWGSRVYVGGKFSTVGSQSRNGLASLDAVTGHVTSWKPNLLASGNVRTLAAGPATVAAGGIFSTPDRAFYAQFDLPPVITAQPAALTVNPTATVRFSVAATGNGPLRYQWRKNSAPLAESSRIVGAQRPILTLPAAQAADAGLYTCEVSNAGGSVVTQAARLALNPTLTIRSARGSAAPPVGTRLYPAGTRVTAAIVPMVTDAAGTVWVCTGWTGTGSAPASGTDARVTFTLDQPTTITWQWMAR